jgi:hypothetical protein
MFTELTYLTEWLIKYYIFKWLNDIQLLEHWQFDDVIRDTKLKHIMKSVVEHSHLHSLARVSQTQVAFGLFVTYLANLHQV